MKKSVLNDFSATDIQTAIHEWVHNERDRKILVDAFINGLSYDQLANKYFLSNQRIIKIVYSSGERILEKLREQKR